MIAVKPIIPTRLLKALDEHALRELIDRTNADEAQEVVKDLKGYTGEWEHDPEFRITVKADRFTREINPVENEAGKIFTFVDKGTRAHDIYPKRARLLKFQRGKRAKTKPGVWGSGPGGGGSGWVSKDVVHHPGSKPRKISEQAKERSRERYKKRMDAAFKEHFG